MSSDAYIRIGSRGVHAFGHTEHHDSLVFVDAPSTGTLAALRHASYALFSNAGTLLVRADSPIDSPASPAGKNTDPFRQFQEQIDALKLGSLRWGVLHQPVGARAWVEGDIEDEESALDRARAIELEALLEWGKAVWTPSTYHYRLPSGEHAAGFVRLADAIQCPRDAEVLASWLHQYLADGIGIVIDTGTLSVLVQALLCATRSRPDWRPGLVNVLDGYPATVFDVAQAVRETNTGGGVLGLLSVSSSGGLRDHLLAALSALPSGTPRSLDVLINKAQIVAHAEEKDGVPMRTWHPRPSSRPLILYDAANADVCEWCRRAATATVISISPGSFDGSLPATLTRVTPTPEDARRNRDLWEFADSTKDAIRLEAKPLDAVLEWRPPGPMPVVVDYDELLRKPAFRKAGVSALREQMRRFRVTPLDADLVLMPEHEYGLDARNAFLKAMESVLGSNATVASFPAKGEWSADLKEQVRRAEKCIAVVSFGAVTGTTLHGALAAVQGARRPGRYDLFAYVLHARLAERRAWETLVNSYGNRIFAAWHSYLPERSPLQDEAATLSEISESVRDGLSEAALAFLGERDALLAGPALDRDSAVFWGSTRESVLTPNSIFGQGLHGPTVYVAVASAMERARQDQQGAVAPVRRVFEMPAIARSYYDPMILSAVLRWLRPHEAWWGIQMGDERAVVASMLERATTEHLLVLVPELLLAGAQGKLNRPGITEVQARATAFLGGSQLTAEQRAPIELGLKLLPDYGTQDAERRETSGAKSAIEAAGTQRALLALVPDLVRDLRAGRLSPQVADELERKVNEFLGN